MQQGYSSSLEFTFDLEEVGASIQKAKDIVQSSRWDTWLKVTDKHYYTQCMDKQEKLKEVLEKAWEAFALLDNELNKAN